MAYSLESYLKDLKNLEINLDKIVYKAIIKKEGLILQKLKLRLFNKGVDGNNSKLSPFYTQTTIAKKRQNNQRVSHVTLRDTGEFYASMYVDITNSKDIFVNSNSDKYLLLAEKYGGDILGLNKEEQDFIIFSIIEPEVINEISKINNKNIDLI